MALRMLLGSVLLAAVCAMPAANVEARTAAANPVVETVEGKIAGMAAGGVVSFKGIPYAAPPVGALRWRPPQPVKHWTDVRPANHFGPLCMQIIHTADNGVGAPPDSEDCLYLNVYAPEGAKTGALPVMFWIHGGGYVNGSGTAALYDGRQLARQGVVVVTINYRLGRLGFFAHPALTRENPQGPLGNYAIMDQIAALQWVRRNIAAFGGDSSNVTIFGESAGGGSVINLMTSPPAQGLFQKAISQSGIARVDFLYLGRRNERGLPSAEELGKQFASQLGVTTDDAAALRAIAAQKIIDAGDLDPGKEGPMIDGRILTARADVVFAHHAESHIPFLLGSNALEFPPEPGSQKRFADLLAFIEPHKPKLVSAYGGQAQFTTHIVSDLLFTEPARFLSQVHSVVAPVYLYRFSVLSEQAPKALRAAPHASDRQYVFRNLRASDWPTGPMDAKAAALISAYWVAFARTGDPNDGQRPVWPKYSPAEDRLLDFRNSGPVSEPVPDAPVLETISAAYRQITP